jgi:putative transposase
MPCGLKRFQKAESLHFITFSCFHRLPLLDAPESRNTVEAVLELTRARHQARVYAYVLMPEAGGPVIGPKESSRICAPFIAALSR